MDFIVNKNSKHKHKEQSYTDIKALAKTTVKDAKKSKRTIVEALKNTNCSGCS